MIARIFLTSRRGNPKIYLFEKRVIIKRTTSLKLNITKLFNHLITSITKPLFKNEKIKFDLQKFEYWTQINGRQQFYMVNPMSFPIFKALPAMIKRHQHHLIDLHVQYSSPN